MTDKQQIEEMITIMKNTQCPSRADSEYPIACDECPYQSYEISCSYKQHAEALYNAGYRKVPENAVVLTREEFDRLNSCIKSEEEVRAIMQQQMLPMVRELTDKEVDKKLATVTALVCKKTAKEILENIKTLVEWGWEMSRIEKWICKNYGVEVEE